MTIWASCPFPPPPCQVVLQVLESVWAMMHERLASSYPFLHSLCQSHDVTGVGGNVGSNPWQYESCLFSSPLFQVMMLQVLESVWAVMHDNMSFLISILTFAVSSHDVTGVGGSVGSDAWQYESSCLFSSPLCQVMMLQVLESVWAVIRGNMSLIMSILTSTVSIVFGGGTAILNFVVSAVSSLMSGGWEWDSVMCMIVVSFLV